MIATAELHQRAESTVVTWSLKHSASEIKTVPGKLSLLASWPLVGTQPIISPATSVVPVSCRNCKVPGVLLVFGLSLGTLVLVSVKESSAATEQINSAARGKAKQAKGKTILLLKCAFYRAATRRCHHAWDRSFYFSLGHQDRSSGQLSCSGDSNLYQVGIETNHSKPFLKCP